MEKQYKQGFKGKIYPVNPRVDQILGLKCHHTLKEINQSVDLVFVTVPAHLVTQIVNDAIAIKAKVLVVATSAFKEICRQKLQDDIVNTCRKAKHHLLDQILLAQVRHIIILTVDLFLIYLLKDQLQ